LSLGDLSFNIEGMKGDKRKDEHFIVGDFSKMEDLILK
jgi:hypothetical protein